MEKKEFENSKDILLKKEKLEEKKINLPKKIKKDNEEEEEDLSNENIKQEKIENLNEYRFITINKYQNEPIDPPNDPNIIFPVKEKHECEDKKVPNLSKLKKKK
jgi:hypothetical protein